MATSELEKLERRYAENPQGLTFAPLAEMYRKNGDVDRALELLGVGIERHPEYIPARIVLGRCHLDRGESGAAAEAFTRVLALDGENVIALKALADVSERLARYDDAERWLQTLLSIDRNNDAAREQLIRLEPLRQDGMRGDASEAAQEPAEMLMAVEPLASPFATDAADMIAEPSSVDMIQPEPEPQLMPVAEPEPMAGLELMPVAELEPAPIGIDEPALTSASDDEDETEIAVAAMPLVFEEPKVSSEPVVPTEGIELTEEIILDAPPAAVDGLMRPDLDGIRDELAHHGVPVDGDEEFRIETADELILRPSSASEFQMPDASQELVAVKPEPDPLAGIPPIDAFEPTPATVAAEPAAIEPAVIEPAAIDPAAIEHVAIEPAAIEHATVDAAVASASSVEGTAAEEIAAATEPETPMAELARESATELPADAVMVRQEHDQESETAREAAPIDDVAVESVAGLVSVSMAEPSAKPQVEQEPDADLSDLIVTETMAEVLVQQGYTADALRVYRELERRNPGDERLRDKRATLEAKTARADAPSTSYAARDTGGRAVGTLFRDLLLARPGGLRPAAATAMSPAGVTGSGAPTRPAADTLSLSAVFGEENLPVPPAVAAGAKRDVSFDEFFGAPSAGAGLRGVPTPAVQEDDLDQFNAWLQNLKR